MRIILLLGSVFEQFYLNANITSMNRHIIFTNGRSGSNYIANIINQHPNAVNYGEVLGDWTLPYKIHQKIGMGGKSDIEYLEYIYKDKVFFL